MRETCIVTGGAGFIGSHLCERLLEAGFRVVCVDNLLSGRFQNIVSLSQSRDFLFLKLDVVEPFPKQFQDELNRALYLFHLASPASPNKKSKISFYARPIETLLVNSYGTYKLLETAVSSKAKFLFASSSEIYGNPQVHPQNEEYWGNVNPTGMRSCYDEAKRFGEAITFAFIRKYKVNVRIVRIFNTYGPKMRRDDGRAVSEFINRALTGTPLVIFGKGSQTRSFCFVSDMVEGIIKAMFSPKTESQVINLGNPEEITILELAKIIKKLTHSDSSFKFEKLPLDDPQRRKPDIKRAKKLLGWASQVGLLEGLKKTIDYFKNYPQ